MISGVVVIGRNEALRLEPCLQSVKKSFSFVVYVDSGSTDHSMQIASNLDVDCLALDASKPFSAARARNEGFTYLTMHHPEIQWVQFIDGDCTMNDGWVAAVDAFVEGQKECAAVVGHLLEKSPEASIYNRLCAMEWLSPTGEMTNFSCFGGISMIRADVFKQLGGFNAQVIAGEDSELGVRMALAGYRVFKINQDMAVHDANMRHFQQWWKRAVRGGHAIGQRADLNGSSSVQDCVRERKSTLFWGVSVPLLVVMLLIPTSGWSLGLLAGYPLLLARVYRYRRQQCSPREEALLYAGFIVLGKFAEGLGLLKFYLNRLNTHYEIIEYK